MKNISKSFTRFYWRLNASLSQKSIEVYRYFNCRLQCSWNPLPIMNILRLVKSVRFNLYFTCFVAISKYIESYFLLTNLWSALILLLTASNGHYQLHFYHTWSSIKWDISGNKLILCRIWRGTANLLYPYIILLLRGFVLRKIENMIHRDNSWPTRSTCEGLRLVGFKGAGGSRSIFTFYCCW